MATYLIAYEEALTKRIEQGGNQEVVDAAIEAYNVFRRIAFDEWVKAAKLTCVHCGKPARDVAEPLEEITCQEHAS